MEGRGRPGGSRVVAVVLLELVRLGVDAPYEEEAGDGGGEEDEDHPQRAHVKLLPCESPKERKGNCEEEENTKQLGTEPFFPYQSRRPNTPLAATVFYSARGSWPRASKRAETAEEEEGVNEE
jgi:hypothetical protein